MHQNLQSMFLETGLSIREQSKHVANALEYEQLVTSNQNIGKIVQSTYTDPPECSFPTVLVLILG